MTAMLSEPLDLRPVLDLVEAGRPDDELSLDELGSRIVGLAGGLAAATCRWLLLVARFDAAEGHRRFGLPSTARWLSFSCGLSQRTAVEHLRVARALSTLPELAHEMASGRLSYAQVRAISRVAAPSHPGDLAELINMAQHSTASQLEAVVRGLRTVESDVDEAPPEYVSMSWSAQSQWRCQARLDPERGALVRAAIDQIARTEDLTQAQALVRLAELGLAALADSERPPRTLRGHERAAVVVHLDASKVPSERVVDQLADADLDRPQSDPPSAPTEPPIVDGVTSAETRARSAERAPYARIADGPGLPSHVVERLLCDGRIRSVVHDVRGHVLDVGRTHRTVSERQYRALLSRHLGHCAHPGCTSTAGLDAHHVRHWLFGGPTDLANLVLLCEPHHLGQHAGEFRIQPLGRGAFRFIRADGRVLEPHVDPSRLDPGPDIDPVEEARTELQRLRTRWDGDRLDRDYAVAVLAQRRERRRRRAG